ncbi:MAG: signal peptide peptidase SppA [Candidatus Hydrogenedentes bacterium]|nr:signal peptide peptidase SppA [Candidatus Hydrogenedentota bacterium]
MGAGGVIFVCAAVLVFYGLVGGVESGPAVAVLEIYDELIDEREILADLEWLLDDPGTQALVVRVDSPGGAITVAEEVYNALKRVEDEGLPVVASMGTTGASGAYMICLAADRVFANKGTLTGSIGVIFEYTSAAGLFEKLGVEFSSVRTGEYKGAGSIAEPITERQKEHYQQVVNDYLDQFVEVILEERGLDEATVRGLADGRVFTGRQALELKLVDEIGGLDDAIDCAAELAGLTEEPRIIRVRQEAWSLFTVLDEVGMGRAARAAAQFRLGGHVPKFVYR